MVDELGRPPSGRATAAEPVVSALRDGIPDAFSGKDAFQLIDDWTNIPHTHFRKRYPWFGRWLSAAKWHFRDIDWDEPDTECFAMGWLYAQAMSGFAQDQKRREEIPFELVSDKDQAAQLAAYRLVNAREIGPIVMTLGLGPKDASAVREDAPEGDQP